MKRLFLLITAIIFFTTSKAQDTTSLGFSVNHLALSVKDVDKAANFYKTVLLLEEITNRTKVAGIRWMALGQGKELHLISNIKTPVTINKAVHLALSTGQFDRFIKRLNDLKVPYSDWPGVSNVITKRADGVQQIYLQDVDGYWIEVNNVIQ